MIILQEAINTFSFSPHIDKESPADNYLLFFISFFSVVIFIKINYNIVVIYFIFIFCFF